MSQKVGRTALCLCGGGITGAVYELGALMALDDFFEGDFSTGQFDLYVGTSAGAFLSTLLAGGVSPRRLGRSIMDRTDSFMPVTRANIFRVDRKETLRIVRDVVKIGGSFLRRSFRRRELNMAELFKDLEDALPPGLFSLEHYERWLEELFREKGIPIRFSEMTRELYITSYDLDGGERVVLGADPFRDVTIPRAICASSAIPLFFEPVDIGGRDFVDGAVGEVAHQDVALARGAKLIVIINPRVPIRHDGGGSELPSAILGAYRIRQKGFMTVYEQSNRMTVRTRLHASLEASHLKHPDAAFLLIEPQETDPDMLLANPMNFAARQRLLRYGYDSAARLLLDRRDEFEEACRRHRIQVSAERLTQRPWDLAG